MLGNSTDECWIIIGECCFRDLDHRWLDNSADIISRRSNNESGFGYGGSSDDLDLVFATVDNGVTCFTFEQ